MESDLRTPAARLRAGLNNVAAAPPKPEARPLPKAAASRLRPLGALLAGRASGDQPDPEPDPPHLKQPRAGGGHRRRYVLRRKLEPPACWPHQYAKLPRRAWDDPRLHRGALATLAVILGSPHGLCARARQVGQTVNTVRRRRRDSPAVR